MWKRKGVLTGQASAWRVFGMQDRRVAAPSTLVVVTLITYGGIAAMAVSSVTCCSRWRRKYGSFLVRHPVTSSEWDALWHISNPVLGGFLGSQKVDGFTLSHTACSRITIFSRRDAI